MARRIFSLFLLTLALLVFLTGCRGKVSSDELEKPTEQAVLPSPTATEIPPTALPTEIPTEAASPTDTPTQTPLPSATPTSETANMTATAQSEATIAAEIEQAVAATLAAQATETPVPTNTLAPSATSSPTETRQPSQTPYPTYTVEPTDTPYPTFTLPPSATPLPTSTPSHTPVPTLIPTSGAMATIEAQRTERADFEAAVAAAVAALPSSTPYPTYTLLPSQTPYPTYTSQPSRTPIPTYTLLPSLTPYPTYTLYPTYTIEPSSTPLPTETTAPSLTPSLTYTLVPPSLTHTLVPPSLTHTTVPPSFTPSITFTASPHLTATALANEAISTQEAAIPTMTAQFEALVAESVAGTLTAWPSSTPIPSSVTRTPSVTVISPVMMTMTQVMGDMTLTATAYVPPTVTFTATVTDTPLPSATPIPPTAAITIAPATLEPTRDLFATATAEAALELALSATPTLAPAQMTATQIVADATETAAVVVTPTTLPATEISPTFWASPTLDFETTATAIVMQATANAEAVSGILPRVIYSVPEGWQSSALVNANAVYLSDNTASIFIYGGDAAYFETKWGIPADETDHVTAAEALAAFVEGEIMTFEGQAAIPVLLPVRDGRQGMVYLAQIEGEWLIISANAPEDQFEDYQADVFEPFILSLDVAELGAVMTATATPIPAPTEALLPAQMTATKIIADATATTASQPTLVPYVQTMTQLAVELTQIATMYVTPTPSLSPTPRPTLTFTPSPTLSPTPEYDLTATLVIQTATSAAEIASTPLDVMFDLPEGWGEPERVNANALYLTDAAAEVFIYRGDAAFFEARWGIPAGETDHVMAAEALAAHLGGEITSFEGQAAIPVLLPLREGRQGIVYLAQVGEGEWLILSASASTDQFEAYVTNVFEPLLLSLEIVPTPES